MIQPPIPFFVALEGGDGAGKTTLCVRLAEFFRRTHRWRVTHCIDPGATEVGKEIRQVLKHGQAPRGPRCEALLFMASRAQLVDEVIRPALDRNELVISDRFTYSTLAYQGYGAGLHVGRLRETLEWAADDLKPDLVVVLDLPVEVARERLAAIRDPDKPDRLEARTNEFEARRLGFVAEAHRDPTRVVVVDANRHVDQVFQAVVDLIFEKLASRLADQQIRTSER